jgi:hypothetical protein
MINIMHKVSLNDFHTNTVKITFDIHMTCESTCSAIVEAYQDDAKIAIKKGLEKDLKKLGVNLKEIDVKVVSVEK